MTVDELVSLTEGITSSISLADVRNGAPVFNDTLSDEQYVILVRFLAGERPADPGTIRGRLDEPGPVSRRLAGRKRPVTSPMLGEDEVDEDAWAEKLAEIEALDEAIEPVDVDLGDGVTLFG